MKANDKQEDPSQPDQFVSAEDFVILHQYMDLSDPFKSITKYSLILMAISLILYFILGFYIPDNPDNWAPILNWFNLDSNEVASYLMVPDELRWNRLLMLCYLSLYFGMWWAYFKSKLSYQKDVENNRLKIQTLRRLLGITAIHWQPQTVNSANDDIIIETFRRKSASGMEVIAILIAVSILIFDLISNIWMSTDETKSLWQYSILWVGMLCTVISFVCFMMCVDALDTIFNRFRSDPIRNVLVKYFYDYTINPRYVATATMLLSIILLIGYHSEVLASMTIAIMVCIGYKLWFPDIRESMVELGCGNNITIRSKYPWYFILILFPIVVRGLTYYLYA